MFRSPQILVLKIRRKGLRRCAWAAGARLYGIYVRRLWRPLRQACIVAGSRLRDLVTEAAFRGCAHLFKLTGLRFVDVLLPHIGHLVCELDCYVKEGLLGMRRRQIGVVLAPPEVFVSNLCALDYWRKYVWVVRSIGWNRLLARFAGRKELCHSAYPYVYALDTTARYGAIQEAYRGRPALLQLSAEHRIRGTAILRRLGLPEGAWFVGVHCRERGYAAHLHEHGFRDVDVDNYRLAMEAIVARGGWCIRMGDPTMKPLPPMPGVIDYTRHPLRSDWMDVFLCASCRFFLGSSSGLCNVASVFGVPSAVANQAPLGVVFPFGATDIGIPKLLWSKRTGRYLTFKEILDGPLGIARIQRDYDEAGVIPVENTPEDIRDMALEMLDHVDGRLAYSIEDEQLQTRFKSLFRDGHYSFGAPSRAGRDFLRKYQELFSAAPQAKAG